MGWAVGWLHAGTGDAAVSAVAACAEPTLILVDDADGRSDLVALLDSLAEWRGNPPIRVILIARAVDGLRASLSRRLDIRHGWVVSDADVVLVRQEGTNDDRARWFGEATRALALTLQRPVPTLPEIFLRSPAETAESFVLLQARALLAVLGTGGDPRELTFGEVATTLMRHEERRWEALAASQTWGSGGPPAEQLRERVIAALALLGADNSTEAEEVLRRVPQLSDVSAERCYDIASWILALYPADRDDWTPRIRPDAIGEWFVVAQLTANPEIAANLRAGMSDKQATRALAFLARAADWAEPAGALFAEFADGDIRRVVLAA